MGGVVNALDYIAETFGVDVGARTPITVEGTRRLTLPAMFAALGYSVGCEVGTELGYFAESLCAGVPGLDLTCVDPWLAYKGYREHVSQDKLDRFHALAVEKLAPFGVMIVRLPSVEAAALIPDGSLDFVYIDANHEFKHVVDDLYAWTPKVRIGGIVSGHDFRRNTGRYVNDVKDVLPGYTYAKGIRPWFVINDPEAAPSWFWVAA